MFVLHLIILQRLLCTLSLTPHGNLETGQETQPIIQTDDIEAQRDHMFTSELNDTYHLQQRAGFTLRKRERCSMAAQGAKKRQHVTSNWINRKPWSLAMTPQLPAFFIQNSAFKEPLPQPQDDQMGYGRYKVRTSGRWVRHRRTRKPLEIHPAYYKAKCISKHGKS